MTPIDILVTGTGSFAARIVFDIAATAKRPVRVRIAGRNRARLEWLTTASNARARIFETPARFDCAEADLLSVDAAAELLAAARPRLIVQAASVQTSSVIAQTGNAWTRLVAEGGLSATAIFQTVISRNVGKAIKATGHDAALINCSFPDVVNGMLVAMGYPILCGTGNVAILSSVFSGSGIVPGGADLKVLSHYQNLMAFRRAASDRSGETARVWIDNREVDDVFALFARVKLTPEPAIDISGASGVPLIQAYIAGERWRGHVPGPGGLPGGYPVVLEAGDLKLDLPPDLSRAAAVIWNEAFERRSGLVVEGDRAVYTGRLQECIRAHDPALADGFKLSDFDSVMKEMTLLRERLSVP
ncbi:MAG: hypothetical protein WC670_01770 [Pseudolabrys sp.]